jgi:hypothetical protein
MTEKVVCKSGLTGWRGRLREVYANLSEFRGYNRDFGIARRLGYDSAVSAWTANPLIEGSVNPSDLRTVKE